MTTKGPLSPRGVWGHAHPEKFEIQKLRNVISSALGIKKCAVSVAFKNVCVGGYRCC